MTLVAERRTQLAGPGHGTPSPPPIVVPDELCATAEQIFRPVDAAAVPEIADVLAWLAEHEPDVVAAVADVDRTLIWCAMEESPLERLARSARMARFYERLGKKVRERDQQGA